MKKIGILLLGVLFIMCQPNKSTKTQKSESKYFTDSIYSKHLSEYRKHNVYLPKDFNYEKKYQIIYATDGRNNTENSFIKRTLDSLISKETVKPIIYIASHSNSKIADTTAKTRNGKKIYLQYRNFEYVSKQYSEGFNKPELRNRFKNHMKYFNDELIQTVEKKYNQKLNKNDRYFYGVSNGAGFGMSLLNKHPNTIGTYLCFSTFSGNIRSNTWKDDTEYPRLYMEYGSEEYSFLKKDANYLKRKYEELGLFGKFNKYDGGHDSEKWKEKFIEIISKILATE